MPSLCPAGSGEILICEGPLTGHHYKSKCSLRPAPVYRQSSLGPGRILKVGSTVSGKLTNCIEVLATGALGKDVRQGRESQIVHFLVPDSLLSLVFFRQTDRRPVFCSHHLPCVALQSRPCLCQDRRGHFDTPGRNPEAGHRAPAGKSVCLTEAERAQPPRARLSPSTSEPARELISPQGRESFQDSLPSDS